jgi:Flp pilus assembly protein TadG
MVAWGIIQFGFVMNRYQGLQAATREGARSGAKSQATIAGIQNTVETALEPVVARSKFVNPCPPDPATLSDGTYCVDVARRDTPTSAPVLLTTTGYDSSVQPCNLGHNKVVVVTVRHRMSYSLVLWSGTINANTAGEFRCES